MKKVLIALLVVVVLLGGLIWAASAFQEKLIFFPQKLERSHQFTFRGGWKELWFKPEEGVELNAVYFPAGSSSHKLVIYFHGNAGSLDSWGHIGHDFTSHGYNTLIVDYRGYGKSTGSIENEDQLHRDAEFIYQQMIREYREKDICIYGRSLGTGVAANLAANHNPAITILETPYYSFTDVASHHYSFLPVSSMLRYQLPTHQWLGKIKGSVYLVHGTNDNVIPVNSSQRLAAENPSVQLTIVEGGGHNNLSEFEAYEDFLLTALHP